MSENIRLPDATDSSCWRRLRHTPLLDLLQGRVTGRLELHRRIIAAGLPLPLAELVCRIVSRTRLWFKEQEEAARELIESFDARLARGESVDDITTEHRDAKAVARRIRADRIRARPLVWRLARYAEAAVGVAVAAAAIIWLAIVVRMCVLKPQVKSNFVNQVNARALAVPEDQRAWPLYRKALLSLTPWDGALDEMRALNRGNSLSPKVLDYLDRNRRAIELVREAAAKPRLGFVYGDSSDAETVDSLREVEEPLIPPLMTDNPIVFELHIEQASRIRTLSDVLRADALRAATQGDASVVFDHLRAQISMIDHVRDTAPLLLAEMNAAGMFTDMLETVDWLLHEEADLLSDDHLAELARLIDAAMGGRPVRLRLDGERAAFHDLWQRIYSDDGNGDGVLTLEGATLLFGGLYASESASSEQSNRKFTVFLSSVTLALIIANRREMTNLADQLLDDIETEMRKPLWQRTDHVWDRYAHEYDSSTRRKIRRFPIMVFMPAVTSAAFVPESTAQRRDATLVAIAIEQFRREHGDWPALLEELTPSLLPEVPRDRFDGNALRYRLLDGGPIIYSVGVDRDDDGGQPPMGGNELARRWEPPDQIQVIQRHRPDGDWILWPPVEDEEP